MPYRGVDPTNPYEDAVHLALMDEEEDRLYMDCFEVPKSGWCDHCGGKASLLSGVVHTPDGDRVACSKHCAEWLQR